MVSQWSGKYPHLLCVQFAAVILKVVACLVSTNHRENLVCVVRQHLCMHVTALLHSKNFVTSNNLLDLLEITVLTWAWSTSTQERPIHTTAAQQCGFGQRHYSLQIRVSRQTAVGCYRVYHSQFSCNLDLEYRPSSAHHLIDNECLRLGIELPLYLTAKTEAPTTTGSLHSIYTKKQAIPDVVRVLGACFIILRSSCQ